MRAFLALLAVSALAVTACGDDDNDGVTPEDIEEELEEQVDRLGARGSAEAVRVELITKDLEEGEHLRDIDILEDATGRIPGSPEVGGLADTTGDGRDDDGQVEISVGDETACISVGEDNETVDVHGGACE